MIETLLLGLVMLRKEPQRGDWVDVASQASRGIPTTKSSSLETFPHAPIFPRSANKGNRVSDGAMRERVCDDVRYIQVTLVAVWVAFMLLIARIRTGAAMGAAKDEAARKATKTAAENIAVKEDGWESGMKKKGRQEKKSKRTTKNGDHPFSKIVPRLKFDALSNLFASSQGDRRGSTNSRL